MKAFLLLLSKECKIELRQREAIVVGLMMSVIGAVIAALGVSNAFLEPLAISRLTPTIIWLLFVLIASQSLSRGHDAEVEMRAIDRILISRLNPGSLFLAKWCLSVCLSLMGHLVAVVLFVTMTNYNFGGLNQLLQFACISFLVCLGFSALAVLITAMTVSTNARGTLVPLLILPVFFPPLLAAITLTSELNRPIYNSPWFTILIVCDLIYLLVGYGLYPKVIREY